MTFLQRMIYAAKLSPLLLVPALLPAQNAPANASQQLVFAGLRSIAQHGQFSAVATDPTGDLYLLFDQNDGVRILKVTSDGSALLAQVHLGAIGDHGTAMALDPSGNIYVTGTSTAGSLPSTNGAAIPTPAAGSTNTFVSGFDSNLTERFLTFTGGTLIASTALAANGKAVFVTGTILGADLPVTENGIEQAPASGSSLNGFVEAFSADGTTLQYATYLTGALGDTTPSGIAVDSSGDAWLVGSTTAPGFPTVSAIIPDMLSTPSGFLMRLTSAGDGIVFSSFVPGNGLSSIALDSTGQTLLIAGSVALGQFPVDGATTLLVPTPYQVLLRMPLDGSSVESGTIIAPGSQSVLAPASNGAVWVGGELAPGAARMLPQAPIAGLGSAYAVRFTPEVGMDETIRFGGLANQQQTYASIPLVVNGLAVDPTGALLLGGAAQPIASGTLLSTETYDLPLRGGTNAALPSTVSDARLVSGTCTGSLCAGSAGYLAKTTVATNAPALSFSLDDLPRVTLRNLGSSSAENVELTTSVGALSSTCGETLAPGQECDALLTGGKAGSITAAASNATSETDSFGDYPPQATTDGLVFAPKELDFGIRTSTSSPSVKTITVTNLGTESASFTSTNPAISQAAPDFSEASSDCPIATAGLTKVLAAGATCHINLNFNPSQIAADDGFISSAWILGSRQVALTGFSQSASLNVSTPEIDFGTEFQGGIAQPRYLYLSNASDQPTSHATLTLPDNSPFSATDGCPSVLAAASICPIRLDYVSNIVPSTDSLVLSLDQGLKVLMTGVTKPPPGVTGSSANPDLSLSTTSIIFGDTVPVTAISTMSQTVGISNSGEKAFPLSLSLTGDFVETTSCGASLAAGSTCAVAIQFSPSQPGARQGLLSVTGGSGTNAATVSLEGVGTSIIDANNGSLSFGGVPLAQPLVEFYKIAQPFQSLSAMTSAPYAVALVEDAGYGHGQPPATAYATTRTGSCHNCWIAVRFTPAAVGQQPGVLNVSSDPKGRPFQLNLIGFGIAVTGPILNPTVADFGSVPVGSQSGQKEFQLTNLNADGSAMLLQPVMVTGDFVLSLSPQANSACGTSLAFGATCSVPVSFKPVANGIRRGTLQWNTPGGTFSASLSGVGTSDPGVTIVPLSLNFTQNVAPLTQKQDILISNTSSTTATIGTPGISGGGFAETTNCTTLAPQATCLVSVNCVPGQTIGEATLLLPITNITGGGGTQTKIYSVALTSDFTANATGLAIFPQTATFGPVAASSLSPSRLFTLYNLTQSSMAIRLAMPQQYALTSNSCDVVSPQASCTFSVAFVPLTNSDIAGTIAISGVPADGSMIRKTVAYTEGFGTGSGSLVTTGGLIVGGIYHFSQVTAGKKASQDFLITNDGENPVTVRAVSSAPPFYSSTNCGHALNPAETCLATVIFSPDGTTGSNGNVGSLNITSDAQSSPDTLVLVGPAGLTAGAKDSAPLTTFTLSQGSLTFPNTSVGNVSPEQTITFENTGNTIIHVAEVIPPPDYSVVNTCEMVAIGEACTITLASAPKTAGLHLEALEITSDAAESLTFVSLIGTGDSSSLSITPSSLDFGSVERGSSETLPVQIANNGQNPVTFSAITTTGNFAAQGNCPPSGQDLPPQASCTEEVTFSPSNAGSMTGTLKFSTSASSNPLEIPLRGNGTASQLSATPGSLSFGNIALGATANQSLVLMNQGSATARALVLHVTGDYAVTIPCPENDLAIGASCTVQVTFTPSVVGARPGTLSVTSSDPNSPLEIPITGNGVQGGSFDLTVNGGSTASVSMRSGGSARYSLLATPLQAFAGTVALTCTPVQAIPYATCSIFPANLSLASGAASAAATVNTIETRAAADSHHPNLFATRQISLLALLAPFSLFVLSQSRHRTRMTGKALPCLFLLVLVLGSGCGGSSHLHYTPAGTYQFKVTASSTSGVEIVKTVTLQVVITAH